MSISYERARSNPEVRNTYVPSLDLGWARRYVGQVVYSSTQEVSIDPSKPEREWYTLMDTAWDQQHDRGIRKHPAAVTVYPAAFDHFEEEGDFLSTLQCHEGRHAYHLYYLPKLFVPSMFERERIGRSHERDRIRELCDEVLCDEFQIAQHEVGAVRVSAAEEQAIWTDMATNRTELRSLLPNHLKPLHPLEILGTLCTWGERDYRNFLPSCQHGQKLATGKRRRR